MAIFCWIILCLTAGRNKIERKKEYENFKEDHSAVARVACALVLVLCAACSDTGSIDAGKGEKGTQTETPEEGGNTGGGQKGDGPVYVVSLGQTSYSLLLGDDLLSSLVLEATVYTDGKAESDARIEFSIADETVAEAGTDGALTAKEHSRNLCVCRDICYDIR